LEELGKDLPEDELGEQTQQRANALVENDKELEKLELWQYSRAGSMKSTRMVVKVMV